MNIAHLAVESKDLPLSLLDPPQLDARIDRDEAALEELTRDISRRGVIYPLIVVRVGERCEIVDGYTRSICAKRAGLVVVPCRIYPSKDSALEGVKYAANVFRLDMTVCDEAIMFNELLGTECGNDIDRLCALVNKSFDYVSTRLELLAGAAEIFDALKAKQIGIGVAKILNTIDKPEYRQHYLQHAIRGGASQAVVATWVQEYRTMFAPVPSQPAPAPPVDAALSDPAQSPFQCVVCGRADNVHLIRQINVHQHCNMAILEPLLRNARGEG